MHEWNYFELDELVCEAAERVRTRARLDGVQGNLSGVVTGSFASFKHARQRGETTYHKPRMTHPDVNLYFFVSEPGERMAVLEAHGRAFTELRQECLDRGVMVIVDTHPFVTPSYPDEFARDDLALVQFTTLAFTGADLESNLPTVCRESWATHYHLLFGSDVLAPYAGRPIARNEGWVASKLRGIVDYAGVLNRLYIGISSGSARTEAIFHQALLYLWEVVKEGIPAALGDEEFERGLELEIRQGKRSRLAPFFEERYGALAGGKIPARRVVEYALEIDDDYFRHRHDPRAARIAIEYAIELCEEVRRRFAEIYFRKLEADAPAMQAAMARHMAWY